MRRTLRLLGVLLVGLVATPVMAEFPAAQAQVPPAAPLWGAMGVARPLKSFEAPSISLGDLSGRPFRLKDFRGRVVMLYFWTTW